MLKQFKFANDILLQGTLTTRTQDPALQVLRGKPFWIWPEHKDTGECCFNHIVSCPTKNDKEFPIFDYEQLIYQTIEQNQNIWIKKARGIGVTTFLIRYLVWKILYSNELEGKSIFIISGTREEFANYVKKKMEDLFIPRFPNVVFDSKYTELWINRTWIKVMPTKNIKDVRGYMDAAYLFIDEADYFNKKEQEELEPAIMAYEEKSKGKTIMVSTPNAPGGLFERIEKDPTSKYSKLFLDYRYGLDKIYDRAFIEKKKSDPEFEREYNLKYLGKVGNVFSSLVIDRAIELGEQFSTDNQEISQHTIKSVDVDFGFGSSKTAIVMTEMLPESEKIRVVFSEEYDHANPQDIVNICFNLYRKYDNTWFWVDGANRGSVIQMKVAFNEETDYEKFTQSPNTVRVIPTNFNKEHKNMLSHLYSLMNKEYLAIPKRFDKLIIALRTASANEYSLDKDATSYDDTLDSFRLALQCYRMK